MGQLSRAALFQKGMYGLGVDPFQFDNFHLTEKGEKEINVGLIGLDGVVCEPLFGDQVAEKERPCG